MRNPRLQPCLKWRRRPKQNRWRKVVIPCFPHLRHVPGDQLISPEKHEKHKIPTRSSIRSPTSTDTMGSDASFPQIPVQTSFKTFNTDIIVALVVMESVYKVDARKAPNLLMYVVNKVFKQKWTVGKEKKTKDEGEETNTNDQGEVKKRCKLYYLDYQLPDRATIAKVLDNFALLSYADMAEAMIEANKEEKTVTFGMDDTVKAAGHKRFDVKTMHVTIINDDKNGKSSLPVFTRMHHMLEKQQQKPKGTILRKWRS